MKSTIEPTYWFVSCATNSGFLNSVIKLENRHGRFDVHEATKIITESSLEQGVTILYYKEIFEREYDMYVNHENR